MAEITSLKLYLYLFFCIFHVTKGNICTPGLVPNITFNVHATLTWSKALNPDKCSIQGYVIDVYDLQKGLQLQFQTSAYVLNYEFIDVLDPCRSYTFEVHALTDSSVLGPSIRINGTTPIPTSPNLSLSLLSTPNDKGLKINWNLKDPNLASCISYYRVVYWDLDNKPVDVYVPEKEFSLSKVIPCMVYHMQVTAIIVNPDLEGPITEVALELPMSAPEPPKFVNMSTNSNSNTMFWKLPEYVNDRCKLVSLTVFTVGAPKDSSEITVPISDDTLRPDVKVVIPDLKPNTVYASLVSLRNIYGFSRNKTVSFETSG